MTQVMPPSDLPCPHILPVLAMSPPHPALGEVEAQSWNSDARFEGLEGAVWVPEHPNLPSVWGMVCRGHGCLEEFLSPCPTLFPL